MNTFQTLVSTLAVACLVAGCQASASLPPAEAATRPAVRIAASDVRVLIIPEARNDVVAETAAGGPPVRREGLALVIGEDKPGRGDCRSEASAAALPLVTVRTPLAADIRSEGAVIGEVRRAGALKLQTGGCGRWRAAGADGPAELLLAGDGAIELAEARAGISAQLDGDGSITVGRADGPLAVDLHGPGRVEIGGGITPKTNLRLRGSGVIEHRGQAGTLEADLEGSGKAHIALVTGTAARKVKGSGDVTWGRPAGRSFCGGVACQRERDAQGRL